jgi:hypothetical protein
VAWFTKKKKPKAAGGTSGAKAGPRLQPRPTPGEPSPKATMPIDLADVSNATRAVGGNVIVPSEEESRPGRPKSAFNPDKEMLYLRHYVKLLNKMGIAHFQAYFSHSFVVGIGLLADLAGGNRAGARLTKAVELDCVETAADGTPGSAGRVWPLRPNPVHGTPHLVSIGRAQSNDVVIPEFAISQKHCQFEQLSRQIVVSDIGSLNGTYINGCKLESESSMEIQNLDVLILGRFQFQFFSSSGFLAEVSDRASMEA